MATEVVRNFFGRYRVAYDCPNCGDRLRSPLTDAGKSDSCPNCSASFVVPGIEDLHRVTAEQNAKAQREHDLAEQRREAKRRKQEEELQAQALARKQAEERRRQVLAQQQHEREVQQQSRSVPASVPAARESGVAQDRVPGEDDIICFDCPNCRTSLSVRDAGLKKVVCPYCGKTASLPPPGGRSEQPQADGRHSHADSNVKPPKVPKVRTPKVRTPKVKLPKLSDLLLPKNPGRRDARGRKIKGYKY